MTRLASTTLLAAVLAVTSGCQYYFGDDDDDCLYGGAEDRAPALELRNPYTGRCEYDSGGGGGGGGCYEGAGAEIADPIDTSDWAVCYGGCEGLDEETCLATPGCRGGYVGSCPEGLDCDDTWYDFYECWGTAPSGPVSDGDCWGLDALECSRHDNCVARHYPIPCPPDSLCDPPYELGNFESCAPEEVEPPPPPPPPACAELTGEAECIAADCAPVYEGVDCTCDAGGCTCADWIFISCDE